MIDTNLSKPQVASKFNAWNEVAGFGIAVIEASWLVLVFQSLNDVAASLSTFVIYIYFTLVFYTGYQLFRAMQRGRIIPGALRGVLLGTYVILTWLGIQMLIPLESAAVFDPFTTSLRGLQGFTRLIPARYWLIPFVLWLFLRGVNVGRQGVGTFAVQRSFRLGVVMFLLYSILAFNSIGDLPGLGIFTVFMFATLLAMASARVAILGRLRGGRRNPFSRSWFGSMTGAVTATITVGFTAAMLATGRFLLFYRQVVLGFFLGAIMLTLAPFIFILSFFLDTPLEPLPAPPQTPGLPPWEQDPGFLPDFNQTTAEQIEIIPPDYRIYFYWGLTALAILILISLFFGIRTISRRRETVELTEYVVQRGDLLDRLRREIEKRRKEFQKSVQGLTRRQQVIAAAKIRRIYSALIQLAETFGSPREPAQTPLEFLEVLKTKLPAASGDLQTITTAYLKIRYGELPEHEQEVRDVENAWRSVQKEAVSAVKIYEIKKKEEEKERKRMEQAR